ncbi:hypothetical protein QFZ94_000758 [Paraburkholderia sp. JPY465]
MKAPPDMAHNIGLSIDMVVPFGFAGSVKAARAASVTMGRIRLKEHEAKTLNGIGGHTLLKHVGKDEAWLRQRLIDEPWIPAATSFKVRWTRLNLTVVWFFLVARVAAEGVARSGNASREQQGVRHDSGSEGNSCQGRHT